MFSSSRVIHFIICLPSILGFLGFKGVNLGACVLPVGTPHEVLPKLFWLLVLVPKVGAVWLENPALPLLVPNEKPDCAGFWGAPNNPPLLGLKRVLLLD